MSHQNTKTFRGPLPDFRHVNNKTYQQPRTGTKQAIRGRNTNDGNTNTNNTRIKWDHEMLALCIKEQTKM